MDIADYLILLLFSLSIILFLFLRYFPFLCYIRRDNIQKYGRRDQRYLYNMIYI